jgi:opacity protein-like surface antigen
MKRLLLTLSMFVLTSSMVMAQIKPKREYSGFFDTYYQRGLITYYLGAGMTNYRGDLVKSLSLEGSSFGINGGAHYKIWPHIVLGAEFSYLTFAAKDFNKNRNLSFNGSGVELGAFGRFYLIDEIIRVAPDKRKEGSAAFCKPYLHLGIYGLYYNATAEINTPTNLTGRSIENISYPRLAAAFPVGFGLQFRINNRMSLCPEYTYRFLLTDKLDGIDKLFGNTKNDGYGTLMFKFQYAPSAPKQKKAASLAPPAPYTGPKGTSTWKTRKVEEQKRIPPTDYDYDNTNTDENTDNPDGDVEEEEVIE